MRVETIKSLQSGRKAGALLGGIVFLVFGTVPGFYFGSYASIAIMSHLAGGPLDPGMIVRALVVLGVALGLFCTAAVCIVTGAVLGTALAYVTDGISAAASGRRKAETTAVETHAG